MSPVSSSQRPSTPNLTLAFTWIFRLVRPRIANFLYRCCLFGLANTAPSSVGSPVGIADTGSDVSGCMPCDNHRQDGCCWLFCALLRIASHLIHDRPSEPPNTSSYPCDGYSPSGRAETRSPHPLAVQRRRIMGLRVVGKKLLSRSTAPARSNRRYFQLMRL